jgi:hypothetical protein
MERKLSRISQSVKCIFLSTLTTSKFFANFCACKGTKFASTLSFSEISELLVKYEKSRGDSNTQKLHSNKLILLQNIFLWLP